MTATPNGRGALGGIRVIADLGSHRDCLGTIASWHFDAWGRLTGADTIEGYVSLLEASASPDSVPSVLVALDGTEPLGSASLVRCDMAIRPQLTPWLAQVFVTPTSRRHGVGAALVQAVADRARRCGFDRLYLYTSGTLPRYYERLGWVTHERVEYIGKKRVVMARDLGSA